MTAFRYLGTRVSVGVKRGSLGAENVSSVGYGRTHACRDCKRQTTRGGPRARCYVCDDRARMERNWKRRARMGPSGASGLTPGDMLAALRKARE